MNLHQYSADYPDGDASEELDYFHIDYMGDPYGSREDFTGDDFDYMSDPSPSTDLYRESADHELEMVEFDPALPEAVDAIRIMREELMTGQGETDATISFELGKFATTIYKDAESDKVIGVSTLDTSQGNPGEIVLEYLAVASEAQRKGYGNCIMQRVFEQAAETSYTDRTLLRVIPLADSQDFYTDIGAKEDLQDGGLFFELG